MITVRVPCKTSGSHQKKNYNNGQFHELLNVLSLQSTVIQVHLKQWRGWDSIYATNLMFTGVLFMLTIFGVIGFWIVSLTCRTIYSPTTQLNNLHHLWHRFVGEMCVTHAVNFERVPKDVLTVVRGILFCWVNNTARVFLAHFFC